MAAPGSVLGAVVDGVDLVDGVDSVGVVDVSFASEAGRSLLDGGRYRSQASRKSDSW